MSKVAGRDKRGKNTNEKGQKPCTQRVCEMMRKNSTPESYERELRTIQIQ